MLKEKKLKDNGNKEKEFNGFNEEILLIWNKIKKKSNQIFSKKKKIKIQLFSSFLK
jgi:hypothetical protein